VFRPFGRLQRNKKWDEETYKREAFESPKPVEAAPAEPVLSRTARDNLTNPKSKIQNLK
jgi:hypothetical protein